VVLGGEGGFTNGSDLINQYKGICQVKYKTGGARGRDGICEESRGIFSFFHFFIFSKVRQKKRQKRGIYIGIG
jgi:hypothetical protein